MEAAEDEASALGLQPADGASCPLAVSTSPPRWEIGIYTAGALVLLGIAAVNLWKLWRSGSYPAPSPFPNYDYRYLEQKYGAAYSDVKHKVKGRKVWLASFPFATRERLEGQKHRPHPLTGGKKATGGDLEWLESLGGSA